MTLLVFVLVWRLEVAAMSSSGNGSSQHKQVDRQVLPLTEEKDAIVPVTMGTSPSQAAFLPIGIVLYMLALCIGVWLTWHWPLTRHPPPLCHMLLTRLNNMYMATPQLLETQYCKLLQNWGVI
ncbi:hypothetical protein E2C01_054276 [Portunus trituberculatus]|uniref:Uncharacterized protein n=1 Tax=Portunus trituberculatus TaxID=210409 RepID=A0A5B7GSR6_PORTR|nr:hypothetical protein [Portunus trituberculatus]